MLSYKNSTKEIVDSGTNTAITAMWLCPELVQLESMGSNVPIENQKFADYISWDKLTKDGCWGKFDKNLYTPEQLGEIGEKFWTSFIAKRGENLKSTLDQAYQLKIK